MHVFCTFLFLFKMNLNFFQVVLFDVSGATLGDQTLGADRRSHTFSSLTPGRRYRSEVITHSGELTNSVAEFGRTCKLKNIKRFWVGFCCLNKNTFYVSAPEPPSHLSVKQGPTNDVVELSWSGPASGDYDDFSLRWTPEDQLSVTQTHLTRRLVGGMFPGRKYNFTLTTVSGGGDKGGPTAKSQPIQSGVRTSRWSLRFLKCIFLKTLCFYNNSETNSADLFLD